jgi:hypothetical protein
VAVAASIGVGSVEGRGWAKSGTEAAVSAGEFSSEVKRSWPRRQKTDSTFPKPAKRCQPRNVALRVGSKAFALPSLARACAVVAALSLPVMSDDQ